MSHWKGKSRPGTAASCNQHCLWTLPSPSPQRKNARDCLTFLERAEQRDVAEDSIPFEGSVVFLKGSLRTQGELCLESSFCITRLHIKLVLPDVHVLPCHTYRNPDG